PKDLVCLAFAAGGHLGLLAFGRPGIAQWAPLGKTGLITKEQQGLALLRLVQNLAPPGLAPLKAFSLAQMIRGTASFRIRRAHIHEERWDIMGMVYHAKVALNEVLNHRRIPASGGIA